MNMISMNSRRLFFSLLTFSAILSSSLIGQEINLSDLLFTKGRAEGVTSQLKVNVGDIAPDFKLPSIQGKRVRLSDYRGKKQVVISFVPAAWTPVCSAQWPGYELANDYFEEANAIILGITVDNIPTLYAWTQAMGGISFPVLSDFYPHGDVASSYGVLRSEGFTERALFVVDLKGVITFVQVQDINERPPLEDLINALKN